MTKEPLSVDIKSSSKDPFNKGNSNRTITTKLVQRCCLDIETSDNHFLYKDDWWGWINLTVAEESGDGPYNRGSYNISLKAAFELMLALDVLLGESMACESEE